MDYLSNVMSIKNARKLAKVFRILFGYDDSAAFEPLKELENMRRYILMLLIRDNVMIISRMPWTRRKSYWVRH